MLVSDLLKDRRLFWALVLSLLFFWRKGIQYALLGSYIPILIPLVFTSIILLLDQKRSNWLAFSIRIWAIAMVLWALVRIAFSSVQLALGAIQEYHIGSQFGIVGMILSFLLLSCAVVMFRRIRYYRKLKAG